MIMEKIISKSNMLMFALNQKNVIKICTKTPSNAVIPDFSKNKTFERCTFGFFEMKIVERCISGFF
jgi:hypothetical protein